MERKGGHTIDPRPGQVDDEVLVDAPTMRSVAIAGPSAAPSFIGGASFGKAPGVSLPPLQKGFGKLPPLSLGKQPPLSFGKPPSLGIPRPTSISKRQISDGLLGIEREWSGVSAGSWDVKSENLEMVPMEFPLERTHREITEDSSVVAKRIAETLRTLSVEAEYCCKKAKAKCKTMDLVSFRIRLFSGSETGQPVIVELQRRNGPASSFMRTCRAILDAAEGKASVSLSQPKRLPPPMKMPVSSLKCLENVRTVSDGNEVVSALDGALNLFRSEAPDSSMMGLENLVFLTDKTKSSHDSVLRASKMILSNEDTREEVRHLIEHDSFAGDSSEIALIKHRDQQRCLALSLFANALSMCSEDGSLSPLISGEEWFSLTLIPSLVDELDRVETGVITAYHASRCLRSILQSSEEALKLLHANGGKDALEKANAAGKSSHELLSVETERCLSMFQYFA